MPGYYTTAFVLKGLTKMQGKVRLKILQRPSCLNCDLPFKCAPLNCAGLTEFIDLLVILPVLE